MKLPPLHSKLLATEAAYTEFQSAAIQKNSGNIKRKRPRSKQAVREEQNELERKTRSEVDALVAKHHRRLSRSKANRTGAIYARYSSRFQSSIADQVRELLDRAVADGIFVPRENVYYDLAVRGWKDRRPGLNQMKDAISAEQFKALLLFSTSRLYRRSYKAMEFVEEQLVARGIRAIFVSSHLDTDDGDNWRSMLQILGVVDEAQVRMMAAQIQSAQAGLVLRRMVHGTIPLGFTGEDVPGELTRLKRARRRIIIDPEAAVWIVRIYRWFLVDGLNIEEIARELNGDQEAPAPAKSQSQQWTRVAVRRALTNPRYRGDFSYGNKQSVWSSEKDYPRQIQREAPIQEAQFDELRIISDEVWFEVQRRLASDPKQSGRTSRDGKQMKQPRLLQGLFACPDHSRRLSVSGEKGKVLLCPLCRGYKVEDRPLFSHLNRELATQLTCTTLASLFDQERRLVEEVIDWCRNRSESIATSDPATEQALQDRINKLRSSIKFNRRDPGESEVEQQQTRQLLRELCHQLAEDESALAACRANIGRTLVVPSEAEVVEEIRGLRQTFLDAPSLADAQQIRLIRRLIDDLVIGKIELHQQGERVKCRGWLQGRLSVAVLPVLIKRLTGGDITVGEEHCDEISIDYKRPELIDDQADTAKRLWDEDLLCIEIAEQMGCTSAYVTKLIQHWFDKRGLPRPNNKERCKRLGDKQKKLPIYKQIANDVHQLMEAGNSNLEIARRISTSGTNVGKAIEWWHKTRGLPVPTAVDRRRKRIARAEGMLEGGMLIADIAKELGYTPRGLKLALKKSADENGNVLIDGRTRRGNASKGTLANGARALPTGA